MNNRSAYYQQLRSLALHKRIEHRVHTDELKHHFVDRESIKQGEIKCGDYNQNKAIEIGAEVFAAEFIYPEKEMLKLLRRMGISAATCSPARIVQFKSVCPAIVSYRFIVKRFEWFGFCRYGEYKRVKFQNLQDQLSSSHYW